MAGGVKRSGPSTGQQRPAELRNQQTSDAKRAGSSAKAKQRREVADGVDQSRKPTKAAASDPLQQEVARGLEQLGAVFYGNQGPRAQAAAAALLVRTAGALQRSPIDPDLAKMSAKDFGRVMKQHGAQGLSSKEIDQQAQALADAVLRLLQS